ncbi:DUF2232 domain-containing protein [Kroppenstedtia eburnea]|uniref:Uncharacterized conserved protein YybS, DUF2232 family n=1 Tax=Kroppenstedtia eburnea TaxID=714067 RepID=A0A1N7JI95_9BACL|nr:DUF2232 domain-containing protein [Kroppenstedtia eburnea]QKI83587.1 DUF2232 domain-containing protein [Kroppenstedtia eburnea]SIS48981.1 Uncharacterized conserved protein YybS, DUF2232 family [Kroppenstedtia eburnea]
MPRIPDVRDGLITTMLFLLIVFSLLTPLNILTIWLLPLPFILQTAKNGWSSAIFPTLLVTFSLLAITGHPFYPGAVLLVAAVGVVMGLLYRRPDTSGTDVVLGGLTTVGISLLVLMLAASHYFDLQNRLGSYLAEEWQRNGEWFRLYGVESVTDLIPYVAAVIPSMLFMLAVPVPLLNLVVARKWLSRHGLPGKYLPPFREWRLPRSFFYFYLVSLLLFLIFGAGGESSAWIPANVITVLFFLFYIQGLSFIAWLLHRSGKGKGWMVFISLGSLVISLFTVVVHLMGVMDTGSEIRKRMDSKRE